ncbi:MAG: hypothetical protein A2Z34_01145 [Planctomycetes bacterium RBG_16_59_8]|nr:MAG: hypothetical protein A2Z34_01145 [Planctomycetes bacterium RBG_16_59_8]
MYSLSISTLPIVAFLLFSCAGTEREQQPAPAAATDNVTVLLFDFKDYSKEPGTRWMESAIPDLVAENLSQGRGIAIVPRDLLRNKLAEKGGTSLRTAADDALALPGFAPEEPLRKLIAESGADILIQGIYYVTKDGGMQIVAYIYRIENGSFKDLGIAQPAGDHGKDFFTMIDNISGTFGSLLPRAVKRFNLPSAARVDFRGAKKIEDLLREKLSRERPLTNDEILDHVRTSHGAH